LNQDNDIRARARARARASRLRVPDKNMRRILLNFLHGYRQVCNFESKNAGQYK